MIRRNHSNAEGRCATHFYPARGGLGSWLNGWNVLLATTAGGLLMPVKLVATARSVPRIRIAFSERNRRSFQMDSSKAKEIKR
jgi:hypothetical protein